jgi:hypothetical protein
MGCVGAAGFVVFVVIVWLCCVGEPLDLTLFLEEQSEAPATAGVGAQTDVFADLPQEGPYVPKKTGIDAYTQMDPEDDDALFDFDVEVEPILDVLVGKTLDQALMELEQETELTALGHRKVRGPCGRWLFVRCCTATTPPPPRFIQLSRTLRSPPLCCDAPSVLLRCVWGLVCGCEGCVPSSGLLLADYPHPAHPQ